MTSPQKKPRILICPLDWGLGHATRCIPLIRELKAQGADIIIAAEGQRLALLCAEFPDAEWVNFPGYRIKYGIKSGAAWQIVFKSPAIAYKIWQEHFLIKKVISKTRAEILISDNRYGLWSKQLKTIFITHQMNIKAPSFLKFTEPWLRILTRCIIRKFDVCWIPDNEGNNNLSGQLSHGFPIPKNSRYIGLLSRFDVPAVEHPQKLYDVVALVSGPEPQRSLFEEKLKAQLPEIKLPCLLVRGLPGNSSIVQLGSNIDSADHLPASQLQALLARKPIIISRPGYSTLMDIRFTGNKAILIPTPGQTEQEYLAEYHAITPGFFIMNQKEMEIKEAFYALQKSEPPSIENNHTTYKEAVAEILRNYIST